MKLGADPEFFIENKEGKLKSIIGLLGGTKNKPRVIEKGLYKVQEDNVAAEYNIPPCASKEDFIKHILTPQEKIQLILGIDKFNISKFASSSFTKDELTHPKAHEFGCDPDYNAWTLEINDRPYIDDPNFRTAGGHVHVELFDKSEDNIIRVVRAMDKHLGVWSVLTDTDDKRRQLYGKAGAFRPQPHGVEYRTLSNYWIFDKDLISEVWDRTALAIQHEMILPDSGEAKMIQLIINSNDKALAKTFLKTNKIY